MIQNSIIQNCARARRPGLGCVLIKSAAWTRRLMSACPPTAAEKRTSRDVRDVPILLQKSLMTSGRSDSVAVARFAMEASDDGAAQARPRSAFLFILPR